MHINLQRFIKISWFQGGGLLKILPLKASKSLKKWTFGPKKWRFNQEWRFICVDTVTQFHVLLQFAAFKLQGMYCTNPIPKNYYAFGFNSNNDSIRNSIGIFCPDSRNLLHNLFWVMSVKNWIIWMKGSCYLRY